MGGAYGSVQRWTTLRRARAYAAPAGFFKRLRDSLPEGRAIAEEVWQRRHRGMIALVWLHVPGIFLYGIATRHSVVHSFSEASIVAMAALGCMYGPKGRRFQSIMATLGLTAASAILVHLSGGLIEFHFHYFIALAVVSLYHDWTPFLVAVGFVAVQHGVMGVLDPRSVYNHADAITHPWKWAAIHAGFVLSASAVSLVRWKSSEMEALKDPLTSLPNRALFGDRLRQALVRRDLLGGSLAVMFLDVDDFKTINDTAGHGAGDRLLIVVGDRLRAVVRPADTVARLGGDEFAIVLEDADEQSAAEVAGRILVALRAPLTFEGRQLMVTASIGIAARSDPSIGEAELVRNADIAMYVAKRGGKGRFALFEPSMHREVIERNELAEDLSHALERDELHLVYQPVNVLSTGTIAGFEALIRWQHPRLGAIGPARFIPLSEETGDIVQIGRWVLETACRQAMQWDHEFPTDTPRWMSVNVSVRQLAEPSFVEHVTSALRSSGLHADRLVLEITETSMVGEDPQIVRGMHSLKALGVRLALDDFGMGYSSLGYLRRLPIDILKIDKTFVEGTDNGPEDAALARAILKIAESMGLACIAEGVERESQAHELRMAGCDMAQGFYFARPAEPDRVEALLLWNPKAPEPRGRILIVDSSEMRSLISRRLREVGFSTTEVSSPEGATRILSRGGVDLVVMDAGVRVASALDLGARMKDDPALRSIPLLLLSGAGDADQLLHQSVGADASIRKPIRGDELINNICTLLERPPDVADRSA